MPPSEFSAPYIKAANTRIFPAATVKRLIDEVFSWRTLALATALRETRVRGPLVARGGTTTATIRKVSRGLAWTGLERQCKIWHCPLGQQCCPNGSDHGTGSQARHRDR